MTGVRSGWSAADRAAAAARALGGAEEAVTSALDHLLRAGDLDWTGPGAAGYREEHAAAVGDVRLVRARLREAEAAVVEHATAVRDGEARDAAAGWPPGIPAALTVPPLLGPARGGP